MVSHRFLRRLSIVALGLAAPAFFLVAFDGLVRGGGPAERPTLIQEALLAPMALSSSARKGGSALLRAGASLWSGTKTSSSAGDATIPPSPRPNVTVRVPILVYHNIKPRPKTVAKSEDVYYLTPEQFEAEMAYLETGGFTSVSFADLAEALAGKKPLPAKPVLITLDDGRDSQWQSAVPSLEKHHLTATFFVFTNAIDRPNYLTWEQLRTLHDKGFAVESHTVYHPFLTKQDDATLKYEMEHSRDAIAKNLGFMPKVLAYPFGLHDERVDAAAKAAGYDFARTLSHSYDAASDHPLDLPGYITTGTLSTFQKIVDGATATP